MAAMPDKSGRCVREYPDKPVAELHEWKQHKEKTLTGEFCHARPSTADEMCRGWGSSGGTQ